MASESLTPPPSTGGGPAKYLILLLLLLGGGLAAFFALRKDPEPPKPSVAPVNPERSTALTDDTLEIPPELVEEDAGLATPEPDKKPARPGNVDAWSCSGELPQAEIRRVLGQGQSAIRSCYERKLRNNNQLQGDVRLGVRIGNDGRVTNTRVQGNMRDAEVKSCIQNVAKGWAFPAPSGGTCAVFEAPFKFQPNL